MDGPSLTFLFLPGDAFRHFRSLDLPRLQKFPSSTPSSHLRSTLPQTNASTSQQRVAGVAAAAAAAAGTTLQSGLRCLDLSTYLLHGKHPAYPRARIRSPQSSSLLLSNCGSITSSFGLTAFLLTYSSLLLFANPSHRLPVSSLLRESRHRNCCTYSVCGQQAFLSSYIPTTGDIAQPSPTTTSLHPLIFASDLFPRMRCRSAFHAT